MFSELFTSFHKGFSYYKSAFNEKKSLDNLYDVHALSCLFILFLYAKTVKYRKICVNIQFNENFEKFGIMKIHYHSMKEDIKISKMAKFACEMFQNVEDLGLKILQISNIFVVTCGKLIPFSQKWFPKLFKILTTI